MENKEWIQDLIIDMIKEMGVEITDDIHDLTLECSKDICEGWSAAYEMSSNYVADQNAIAYRKQQSKDEVEKLKKEISLLEKFISAKGYNFIIRGDSIYERGMEHVGGTVWGSFEREVR